MNTTGIVANAGALARLAVLRRAAPGGAVLGYHDVAPDDSSDEPYTVSATQLRTHIRALRELGLSIVPLADIVRRHRAAERTDGLAALTFDDALVGVYEHALPVLADEGAPATVFVVTDAVGVAPSWWSGARRTMTAAELGDARDAGIALEAHSSIHASLPSLGAGALTADLVRGRRRLHDEFGVDSTVLAYPFGHHDPSVRAGAADAGFTAAVTFLNGRVVPGGDPYRIPRLTAHRRLDRLTLARHLCRAPARWPDHQVDVVLAGGPSSRTDPPAIGSQPSVNPPDRVHLPETL